MPTNKYKYQLSTMKEIDRLKGYMDIGLLPYVKRS